MNNVPNAVIAIFPAAKPSKPSIQLIALVKAVIHITVIKKLIRVGKSIM